MRSSSPWSAPRRAAGGRTSEGGRLRIGRRGRPSRGFVYTIDVSEHLLHGKPVTDEQIQMWADEAEAGYDPATLPKPRRGRPPVGGGPGVVPVRFDAATLAALNARAQAEGIQNRSEAIRAAVRAWAHIA